MNEAIRQLEPRQVWKHFADLNAVPRPSKKEDQVIKFMLDFGAALGLKTFKDKVGNVIIRKPASKGMENRKMVTLQSHLDMVHQKNADTSFDFETEGIRMHVEGEWVKARGTTLGADNGMGVASIMALLASKEIPHPPLEALFTIDEETGMTGALGLESGILQGELLLNLDTEEDDEIDIGCAGGMDITAVRAYKTQSSLPEQLGLELSVSGLKGGHSGIDIHLGLGNANKLLTRVLFHATEAFGIGLASIEGGGLRNAIPREARAQIVLPSVQLESFREALDSWSRTIRQELATRDPGLRIRCKEVDRPGHYMREADQKSLLRALYTVHNGVYAMSATLPNLVETSNNLARVEVGQGQITVACLCRSSVDSAKYDLGNAIRAAFELAGCEVSFSGEYPGWTPDPHSELLQLVKQRYTALHREEPRVVACHAGLECGILGRHYPEMDMVSFGPTIKGAHSPDERVHIASVQKFWNLLRDVLHHTPVKD